MFALIITIISIALVAALALATIFYGGAAFRQAGAYEPSSKVKRPKARTPYRYAHLA